MNRVKPQKETCVGFLLKKRKADCEQRKFAPFKNMKKTENYVALRPLIGSIRQFTQIIPNLSRNIEHFAN